MAGLQDDQWAWSVLGSVPLALGQLPTSHSHGLPVPQLPVPQPRLLQVQWHMVWHQQPGEVQAHRMWWWVPVGLLWLYACPHLGVHVGAPEMQRYHCSRQLFLWPHQLMAMGWKPLPCSWSYRTYINMRPGPDQHPNTQGPQWRIPPIFKMASMSQLDAGPHMADLGEATDAVIMSRLALISSYLAHQALIPTPLLHWYLLRGLVVTRLYVLLEYDRLTVSSPWSTTVPRYGGTCSKACCGPWPASPPSCSWAACIGNALRTRHASFRCTCQGVHSC